MKKTSEWCGWQKEEDRETRTDNDYDELIKGEPNHGLPFGFIKPLLVEINRSPFLPFLVAYWHCQVFFR